MTQKAAWALALGVGGLVAYGLWLAFEEERKGRTRTEDEAVNEASEDSFPASDAPSNTPVMGSRVATSH